MEIGNKIMRGALNKLKNTILFAWLAIIFMLSTMPANAVFYSEADDPGDIVTRADRLVVPTYSGSTDAGGDIFIRPTTDTADGSVFFSEADDITLLPHDAADTTELRFRELASGGTNYIAVKAPTGIGTDVTLTLPPDDGTANEVLTTNGSGVLTWEPVASSSDNDWTIASPTISLGTGISQAQVITTNRTNNILEVSGAGGGAGVADTVHIYHTNSSGNGDDGIATGILFGAEQADGTIGEVARIRATYEEASTADTETSSLRFYHRDGTASLVEAMIIDDAGEVGIGTSAPTSELEVDGDIEASASGSATNPTYTFNGLQSAAGMYYESPAVKIAAGGDEIAAFRSNGTNPFVGIGVSSSVSSLPILAVHGDTVAEAGIEINMTGGGDPVISFQKNGTEFKTLGLAGTGFAIESSTGNAELVVTSAADVGIGAALPSSRLDVVDEDPATNTIVDVMELTSNTSGSNAQVGFGPGILLRSENFGGTVADAARFASIWLDPSATNEDSIVLIEQVENGTLKEGMRLSYIDSTAEEGAVAINTFNALGSSNADPATQLHVVRNTTFNNSAQEVARFSRAAQSGVGANNIGSAISLAAENNSEGTEAVAAQMQGILTDVTNGSENGDLTFLTSNSGALGERMRVDSAGNVGIGQNNPDATLDVLGTFQYDHATAAANFVLTSSDVDGNATWVDPNTLVSGGDHGSLTGLTDDDHTQYALLAGRGTNQTLIGGAATTNTLTLQSNAAADGTGTIEVTNTDALVLNPSSATVGDTARLVFEELAANGTDSVSIRALDSITTAYTLTLPPDDGDANEVLTTNGSGILTWEPAGDGDWTIVGNDMNSTVSGNVGIGVAAASTAAKLHVDGTLRFDTGNAAIGDVLVASSVNGDADWAAVSTIDHGSLGGLTDDDHTQYALLAGRGANQTLIGGAATTNTLTLQSNAAADGTGDVEVRNTDNVILYPSAAGAGNTTELRFRELDINGAQYFAFKAPDAMTSNSITATLPPNGGTSGQVLSTSGGDNPILTWVAAPSDTDFDIVSSVNLQIDSSLTGYVELNDNAGGVGDPSLVFGSDSTSGFNGGSGFVRGVASGAEAMRFNSAGLSVTGNSASDRALTVTTNASATTASGAEIINPNTGDGDSTLGFAVQNFGTNAYTIGVNDGLTGDPFNIVAGDVLPASTPTFSIGGSGLALREFDGSADFVLDVNAFSGIGVGINSAVNNDASIAFQTSESTVFTLGKEGLSGDFRISVGTLGTSEFMMDSVTGNVGIGTTNASSSLTVAVNGANDGIEIDGGFTDSTIFFDNSSSNADHIIGVDDSASNWVVAQGNNLSANQRLTIAGSTGNAAFSADLSVGDDLSVTNDIDAGGYIQPGTSATCTSAQEGALSFDSTHGILVYCDGSTRVSVAHNQVNGARQAFTTADTYDGDLGGPAGADAKCNTAAQAAGFSGLWFAILSSTRVGEAASDKIGDDDTLIKVNLAETTINFENLWSAANALSSAMNVDEDGNTISSNFNVWTGSTSNGASSGTNCSGWSSNSSGTSGTVGLANNTGNAAWISNSTQTCDNQGRLYCARAFL